MQLRRERESKTIETENRDVQDEDNNKWVTDPDGMVSDSEEVHNEEKHDTGDALGKVRSPLQAKAYFIKLIKWNFKKVLISFISALEKEFNVYAKIYKGNRHSEDFEAITAAPTATHSYGASWLYSIVQSRVNHKDTTYSPHQEL
ncbi:hypothetical protein SERLA73DRAFT_154169 [Serpula lacrymans var. lacrymans S7.3]|uniref:Uncharacterized protein n=1 Tax=Serpula lacrymans var. lacrymans (strain S7.3) TaxID=936435 RepID=F8Q569_SERL3|nr:hypothetical protein SERLA73DRAFT_154169 [Serpula lacrymans var. lacrymans S7.3]